MENGSFETGRRQDRTGIHVMVVRALFVYIMLVVIYK